MKKKVNSLLQAGAIMGILCTMICLPTSATQSQIDEVNENIGQLEKERENSRQELEELQKDKAYLEGRLSELNQKLSDLAAELTSLQEQLTQKETEIADIREQLVEARAEEETQYENMKKRIRFFYEKGNLSFLEALLKADSFADFLNLSQYAESIQSYDRKMLAEYSRIREEIAAKETRLTEEQKNLETLTADQEEKLQEAEGLLAEINDKMSVTARQMEAAESDIASYDAQLEQQRAYEEELEAQKAAEDARRLEEIKKQQEEKLPPPVISDSASDLALLAAIIECEAGGESYEGKLAVGSVIMNRVRSSHFPNTVFEVIYQSGQFTPVASGRFATVLNRGASKTCIQAARENLSGTLTLNCLYFRKNTGAIEGTVIGNHVFF